MTADSGSLSFWEHLDELRGCIWRILIVVVVFALVAFFFKRQLFSVVLAPRDESFITYRLLSGLSAYFLPYPTEMEAFNVKLINTALTQQFVIHMKTAINVGFLCAAPYILYQLFHFVSPALYQNERKLARRLVAGGYVMFMLGVALNYFLIFPLTFRFLGTYQVSPEVENTITLDSYTETLFSMNIALGVVFEIPVLCWLLARFGFITDKILRRYRRHAVVVILVVAAIITPTSDIFTLLLVSVPIWILYEFGVLIAKYGAKSERAVA